MHELAQFSTFHERINHNIPCKILSQSNFKISQGSLKQCISLMSLRDPGKGKLVV